MERIVDYPRGPLRGRDLVEGRLLDITIHTWDLARSIDADERLNERLVRRCLSAHIFQRRVGHDGDGDGMPGSLSATQLQDRLLRASGRSPS